MARLTNAEKHLLAHPPTEQTWLCKKCQGPCAGSSSECWVCGTPKPKKPTLLWPTYLKACEKAGVEPGLRQKASEASQAPTKHVRRKAG